MTEENSHIRAMYIGLIIYILLYIRKIYNSKKNEKKKNQKRKQQLKKQTQINKLKKYFGKTFNYSARSRYGPNNGDVIKLMNVGILKKCNKIGTKEDTFSHTIQQNSKTITIKGGEIQTINSVYTAGQSGGSIHKLLVGQNNYDERYTDYIAQHFYIISIEYDQSRIEKHGKIILKSRYGSTESGNIGDFLDLMKNPIYYSIKTGVENRNEYQVERNLTKVNFFQQEFNKLFKVKTNDQVFARYIINPAFMESITNFAIKMGKPLDFYLNNGEIYIILHLEENEKFLEPEYRDEQELEQKLYQELQNIINVVKELNLLYWAKINYKEHTQHKQK